MRSRFLFQVFPYLAVVLSIAGIWVRYVLGHGRSDRGVLRPLKVGDFGRWERLLCVSLFSVFLGHLAEVVFPQEILHWNSVAVRLYTLEASAFGAGILALAGWMGRIWRRLMRPAGTAREHVGDEFFWTLVLVVLLTGSFTAVVYRWGSSWGVMTLTPYVRSLLRTKPIAELAVEMPFLVRLHVFSSFLVLLVFPFTRPAQVLLFVLDRGVSRVRHPLAIRLEQVRQAVRLMLERRNPAEWLWPEED